MTKNNSNSATPAETTLFRCLLEKHVRVKKQQCGFEREATESGKLAEGCKQKVKY